MSGGDADGIFRALLIVNWEFPNDRSGHLPRLEGASHDAAVLTAALTDGEFGLFRPENVTVRPNKPVAAVKTEIAKFIDQADDDDTLLLYYSGHGKRFGTRLYLTGYDSDGANIFGTGLNAEEISQYIAERNRARNLVVVLDCCHAGAFGKGDELEVPDSLFGEGQYLLASSRWFETSRDSQTAGRPSPFTEALSQALLDPALSGGTNGRLTVQQVYDDLYERYKRHELEVGPQKTDRGRGRIAIAKRPAGGRREGVDYFGLVQTLVLEGDGDEFFSVAISPDCKTIAAGTDGAVLLWSGDTEIWRWNPSSAPEPVSLARRGSQAVLHDGYVYAVAFSPDGRVLASAGQDDYVRFTGLDGEPVLDRRHDEAVYSVAFAPDGRLAASGGWDGQVMVWDLQTRTRRKKLSFGSPVSSVAFAPQHAQHAQHSRHSRQQERILAVGCLDNSVWLWDIAGSTPQPVPMGHASSVEAVAFSADGRLLASCGLDKSVRMWDVRNNERLWAEVDHGYLVRSIAFAPDGETLASAGWDKAIKLWNTADGEVGDIPFHLGSERHEDWIWAVRFSRDGKALVSAGSDSRIIVWSVPDRGTASPRD